MVFLGYEKPVELGREQVFDPTTAQMVLSANRDYINAVYNDYQQAMQDMKEFNKEYGDFISPIQADMDWYYNNVTGNVRDFINDLYARGIDPLRSREGRAAITRKLATMPVKGISQVRQSAKAAEEYLKNRAELMRLGKWNPNYEKSRLGGMSVENWNTMGGNGVFTQTSPDAYQDLNELTGHIFDKMKDEYMGEEGGYDYFGVSRKRRENALASQLSSILNSDLGKYHYEQTKAALEAEYGRPVADKEVLERLKNNILDSTSEYEHRNRTENKEYARSREYAYANSLDAAKSRRDYYYTQIAPYDLDANGTLDESEKSLMKTTKTEIAKTGGDKNKKTINAFREAEAYAKATSDLYGINNIAGLHSNFAPGNTFNEGVDPILNSDRVIIKDSNKVARDKFVFAAKDIYKSTMRNGTIFTITDNGEVHPLSWQKKGNAETFDFVPDGNMRAIWDGSGYKYYISGKMTSNDGYKVQEGRDVWIQVKEGRNGQGKQKK